ncbi:2-isopropylmalate synthase [Clostridia bacterium]|nr:2-isopropylmalate synthase [Clostridia bacterium]
MKNVSKYERQYFMPPVTCNKWAAKSYIAKAPDWCSVDLRDGNQALINPMSFDEKLLFWNKLLQIGFKEIEIGFPAASETERLFCRHLIENNLIPDGVAIQALTQARPQIIEQTYQALADAPNAVIHFYNSVSRAQREQVFRKDKPAIVKIATDGAKLVKEYAAKYPGNYRFQYSPESFTGAEPEFSLEICNEVLHILEPSKNNNVIINLPVTVETSSPHVYASQVEYVSERLYKREFVTLSLHPHNDRGTGVACAELGLLAGGDRIEGTLFGNGERTGNVDIITLAMNMYSQGVSPGIDLSDMPGIVRFYESVTGFKVSPRHPYCGELVFAAFSGSHQDAIAKGMECRNALGDSAKWTVPYLPIDPSDVGRKYDSDVIRINSQSGKGGVAHILSRGYGIDVPPQMRALVGYAVKDVSDVKHRELSPEEVYGIFTEKFVNVTKNSDGKPLYVLKSCHYKQEEHGRFTATAKYSFGNRDCVAGGTGNGRLDALCVALRGSVSDTRYRKFNIVDYVESSLGKGSTSRAQAYVQIQDGNGAVSWGAGIDTDIVKAADFALFSALNRLGE